MATAVYIVLIVIATISHFITALERVIDITMPGVSPDEDDFYMCFPVEFAEEEVYITKFEAIASADVAHHMILFGCKEVEVTGLASECHSPCARGEVILYAWARNADPVHLPKNVAAAIGGRLPYLNLQIHYRHKFSRGAEKDMSGVRLTVTDVRPLYLSGILLMVSSRGTIPANTQRASLNITCAYTDSEVMHPFAFRVHSHTLGKVTSGYSYNGTYQLLGKGNPQWPQAFYPMDEVHTVKPGDTLAARCVYNSTGRFHDTVIGGTHNDEMCNFYIMYYSVRPLKQHLCEDNQLPEVSDNLPPDSLTLLPPNPALDAAAEGHHHAGGHGEGHDEGHGGVHNEGYIDPGHDQSIIGTEYGDIYGGGGGRLRGRGDFSSLVHKSGLQKKGHYRGDLNSRTYASPMDYDESEYDYVLPRDEDPNKDYFYYQVMNQRSRYRHPELTNREEEYRSHDASHMTDLNQPMTDGDLATNQREEDEVTNHSNAKSNQDSTVSGSVRKTGHSVKSTDMDKSPVKRSKWVKEVVDWEKYDKALGQVAGVAVDSHGNVNILHRGSRVWDDRSFDRTHRFLSDTPIEEMTVLTFDRTSGKVIKQWGNSIFYLPHGLHIDHDDNLWITDVAMHQVFKFTAGSRERVITLGELLVPGSDDAHLCQPADVAVMQNGDFFVADGYCNSRILKFSADGKLLKQWGSHSMSIGINSFPPPSTFDIPHSLALMEDKSSLCVADRENGRLQMFWLNGTFRQQFHPEQITGSYYAVTYSQPDDMLYLVTSTGSSQDIKPMGYTVNVSSWSVVGAWKPENDVFHRPHDIAVDPSGNHIFVGEIGPNKLWHFSVNVPHPTTVSDSTTHFESHQSVKKDYSPHPESVDSSAGVGLEEKITRVAKISGDFGVSLVIGALLVVPVLVVIIVTIILRLRKNESNYGYKRIFLIQDDEDDA